MPKTDWADRHGEINQSVESLYREIAAADEEERELTPGDWLELDDDGGDCISDLPETPGSHEELVQFFRPPILRRRYQPERLSVKRVYHGEDWRREHI